MKLNESGSLSLITSLPGDMDEEYLPPEVVDVSRENLRAFHHTKRVGQYLLGRTLGQGSFAKVKEAIHILTGEKVAVKVIDKKAARSDAYVRKNLRREGKLLQLVCHRHVVRLYEIMETENSYYLVTELCSGGDLMDYICVKRKLPEEETRKFIRQILSAVHYLHRSGILHRDLKIENLLLDENRDIKIIDFGLSNSIKVKTEGNVVLPQELCVTQCGSPAYAAPELLGNDKYGPQVDVWSIGVNMYAMLTGTLPFTVDPFNIKTLHAKMLKGSINKIPDNLSEDCKQLIHQFLIADPNKRITIEGALKHDWITKQSTDPLETAPFPNKLRSDDLDMTIIKHMTYKMSFRLSDVIRLVSNNIPNTSSATYHLLVRRLEKFNNREKLAATVLSAGDILEFGNSNNRKDENKNVEREEVKPPKRLTSIKNAERKLQKRRVMKANHVLGKRTESNNSDHNNNPPPNPSKSTEPKILPILPNRKSSITRASTGLSTDIVKSPKTLDERRIGTAKIFPSMTSPRTSSTSRYSSALLPRRRTSTNSYLPSISSELND